MTVNHRLGVALGCLLIIGPVPAAQAAGLPWKDANPLERLFGPSKPAKGETRNRARPARAAPAKVVPALADVPVPDARPERANDATAVPATVADQPNVAPAEAEAAGDDEVAKPVVSAKVVETPKSNEEVKAGEANKAGEATNEVAESKGASEKEESEESAPKSDAAKVPSPPAADASLPVGVPAGTPVPESVPADPAETAKMPIDEIPVPVVRPEAAGDEAAKPGTVPDAPVPAKTPTEPESEPNSTENLKSRTATVTPAAAVLAAAAIEDAEICEAELKKRGVEFTVGESISEGECGVLRPVNVKQLSSGITVSPDTQFLCRTALALDEWMTAGVLPAVKAELPGRKLSEFRHASTYVCRPRASESGISEHARGSAIDIAAFVFDKGEDIGVAAQAEGSPEAKFQAAIRTAACGPFKTVLGPGTDPDHATHFHLDIAARKTGATYCK